MHVTNSYGGGTEQYLKDMCTLNIEAGYIPVILRFSDKGESELEADLSGTQLVGFFAVKHRETYFSNEIEILKSDIDKLSFERFHLHSPLGMSMPFLEWLVGTHSTTITIHDYAWICPRITLTTASGRYCGEPEVEQCNQCISFYRPHPGLQHFIEDQQGNVAKYRNAFGRVLAKAETVFSGAQDVVKRMERHGIKANYKIVPHPVPKNSFFLKKIKINQRISPDNTIKVALIGAISDIKGFYQLLDCAIEAERIQLPIEFIIFGKTMDDNRLQNFSNVRILGPYKEEELEGLMLAYRPNLAFFPNEWPETFSYTLSHAFRFGLWPVVADIGAPAERVRACGTGSVYHNKMTPREICDFLIKAANTYAYGIANE